MKRGYFGIGVESPKTEVNIGTLWRTAGLMGAKFIFTINHRYRRQPSDTPETQKHIPLFSYQTIEDFIKSVPYDCLIVGVELDETAIDLKEFKHPERAIYLLGAEDNGLSRKALNVCNQLIRIDTPKSLNVSVAGSIVLYDRSVK